MAKSKLIQANENIAEHVSTGFKQMADGVTSGFRKINDAVVDGYTKIEDHFVDQYLTKDGESVEDAKARLKKEQTEREKAASPAPSSQEKTQ